MFFYPIASLVPPPNTHPPAHTSIPGTTRQYNAIAPKLAWLSLLVLLAASQRDAFLAPLASSVYNTTAAARGIDAFLSTTATPTVALAALGCVQRHERSFGSIRLSPTPPTCLDEGSSCAKHALLAENARSTALPTNFRLPYSSIPSHQPLLGRTRRIQSKKVQLKRAVFDCRNPMV